MKGEVPSCRFLCTACQQNKEDLEESKQHEDDLHPREDVELRPQPDGQREESQCAGPVDDVEQPDNSEEERTASF